MLKRGFMSCSRVYRLLSLLSIASDVSEGHLTPKITIPARKVPIRVMFSVDSLSWPQAVGRFLQLPGVTG